MALNDSLIAYFKFDETSGTTAENAANPGTNDGTLTLGTSGSLSETGKIGTAILFDNGANNFGTNHFSSSTFSSNGLTITTWIKCTSQTTIFSFEGGWDAAVDASGYVNFKIDGNAPDHTSTSTVDDGNWHFIALTATSGGTCKIYVDGSTAETSFTESWYNIDGLTRGQCLPGSFSAASTNATHDETAIWNRALSDSEIGELYNSGSGWTYPFGTDVTISPSAQTLSLTQNSPTISGANVSESPSTQTLTLTQQSPTVDITETEFVESESIFLNSVNILTATPNVTIDSGSVNIYLSNDGGTTWESATNETKHTFTTTGQDLRYKISGTGAVISKVEVRYTTA